MTITVKTVENELQRRLRIGTGGIAISDSNLYTVMNYVQRTLNYALKRDVSTGTYTASATDSVISYTSASISSDCYAVLAMYDSVSGESLINCPNWNALQQADSSWLNQGATKSLVWASIGRNMLAVYPASSQTYNAVYLKETTTLDSSADTFTIPDADINLVHDLCEVVWLAHLRFYEEAALKGTQLKDDLAVRLSGVRNK